MSLHASETSWVYLTYQENPDQVLIALKGSFLTFCGPNGHSTTSGSNRHSNTKSKTIHVNLLQVSTRWNRTIALKDNLELEGDQGLEGVDERVYVARSVERLVHSYSDLTLPLA